MHTSLEPNLQGLPRVNWLTLDRSWPRQEAMIRQFERLGINNHCRHRAIDGSDPEFLDRYKIRYPQTTVLDPAGIVAMAVGLSHLMMMIRAWYENTNEYIGFFCEDDVNLELARLWPHGWRQVVQRWPEDCYFMQLCLVREDYIPDWLFDLQPRYEGHWGLTAYAITREHAKRVVKEVFHTDGEYDMVLPDNIYTPPWAEYSVIRNNDRARTWPLFSEREMVDSESPHYHANQHRSSERIHSYYRSLQK